MRFIVLNLPAKLILHNIKITIDWNENIQRQMGATTIIPCDGLFFSLGIVKHGDKNQKTIKLRRLLVGNLEGIIIRML